jgi:hypothetical protein
MLLATAYAAGFVIVTLHHSQYGVLQFDILRPRVIAAGVTFLALMGLPIYIAFFLFNISLLKHDADGLSREPEHDFLLTVIAACWFCGSCWLLVAGWNYLARTPPNNTGLTVLVGLMVVDSFVTVMTRGYFRRAPRLWTWANCLTVGIMFLAMLLVFPSGFVVALWFSVVGLSAVFVYHVSRQRQILAGVRWDVETIGIGLFVLVVYARFIYGSIGVAFGGGAPALVTVHLARTSPLTKSDAMSAKLLDETELGYYLLAVTDGSERAVFVPRGEVAAIEFPTKTPVSASKPKP